MSICLYINNGLKLTERLSNGSITQSICQCQFITYVWQIMNAVISTKPVELFKYYLMVVEKYFFDPIYQFVKD